MKGGENLGYDINLVSFPAHISTGGLLESTSRSPASNGVSTTNMMTPYLVIFVSFVWIMSYGISFGSMGFKDDLVMIEFFKNVLPSCV